MLFVSSVRLVSLLAGCFNDEDFKKKKKVLFQILYSPKGFSHVQILLLIN